MSRRNRKRNEAPPADDLAAEFRRNGQCENCGRKLGPHSPTTQYGTFCDSQCAALAASLAIREAQK